MSVLQPDADHVSQADLIDTRARSCSHHSRCTDGYLLHHYQQMALSDLANETLCHYSCSPRVVLLLSGVCTFGKVV